MARVAHPLPLPGTQTFIGITFHDGFAELDLTDQPIIVEALLQHGYTIEDTLEGDGEGEEPEFIDLNKLKLPELRDIATTEGIDFDPKATKPELVDLISRHPFAEAIVEDVIAVGSIVALTDEAIALIGGDTDSRARVLEVDGASALVEWLTPSESPITSPTLNLLKLAPVED